MEGKGRIATIEKIFILKGDGMTVSPRGVTTLEKVLSYTLLIFLSICSALSILLTWRLISMERAELAVVIIVPLMWIGQMILAFLLALAVIVIFAGLLKLLQLDKVLAKWMVVVPLIFNLIAANLWVIALFVYAPYSAARVYLIQQNISIEILKDQIIEPNSAVYNFGAAYSATLRVSNMGFDVNDESLIIELVDSDENALDGKNKIGQKIFDRMQILKGQTNLSMEMLISTYTMRCRTDTNFTKPLFLRYQIPFAQGSYKFVKVDARINEQLRKETQTLEYRNKYPFQEPVPLPKCVN